MLLLILQNHGVKPSGGIPYSGHETRRRSVRDVQAEREALGILPRAEAVIEAVAQRQAAAAERDEQKQFDELKRQLDLARIEWDARYLELLNARREELISREVALYMQRMALEEENAILLLLAATA